MSQLSLNISTSSQVRIRNKKRYEKLYLNSKHFAMNMNNNRSSKQSSNTEDEEETEDQSTNKKKVKNEDEYSQRMMELYPLGFNPLDENSGYNDTYDEEEDETETEGTEEETNPASDPMSATSSKYKKIQTPRKKKKKPKEAQLEKMNSNDNDEKFTSMKSAKESVQKPGSVRESKKGSLVVRESTKKQESHKGATQPKSETINETEDNTEDDFGEEEEEEDYGYYDSTNQFPCVYNVWVQDCCRTRRDFIYCQQLDLSEIKSKEEFQKIMYDGGFMSSVDDYEYFIDCLRTSPNRTIQGVETKFCLEIDVSDAFYGFNGNRLRAYSFQGKNRKSVFSAYNFFRGTWTADMAVHSLQDYDEPFRPDDWFDNVLLIDKGMYDQLISAGEEEEEEEDMLEPSTEDGEPPQKLSKTPEPKSSQKKSVKSEQSKKESMKKESTKKSLKENTPKESTRSKKSVKNEDDDDSDSNQSNVFKKISSTDSETKPGKKAAQTENNDNNILLNPEEPIITTDPLETIKLNISEENQIKSTELLTPPEIIKEPSDDKPNSNPNNSEVENNSIDSTTISDIQSNCFNWPIIKPESEKSHKRIKDFINYFKYPSKKIKKMLPIIVKMKHENDTIHHTLTENNSSNTISNMVKLIDVNNNKLVSLNTSNTKHLTNLLKTKYKISKYLIDNEDEQIPVWIKINKKK